MKDPCYTVSTAPAAPERVIANDDLVQFPAAMRPVIANSTGIRARRHPDAGTAASDLALPAAGGRLVAASPASPAAPGA